MRRGDGSEADLFCAAQPLVAMQRSAAIASRTRTIFMSEVVTGLSLIFVKLGLNRSFDFSVQCRIALEGFFGGISSLGQLRASIVQPGAALFDNLFFQSKIE